MAVLPRLWFIVMFNGRVVSIRFTSTRQVSSYWTLVSLHLPATHFEASQKTPVHASQSSNRGSFPFSGRSYSIISTNSPQLSPSDWIVSLCNAYGFTLSNG
ncbi:hypothetical protein AVEN_243414-1 [Araneus ventricosus]|uniref:Secreted protein n=1 Tax=Araneus ventricosus TaxID=182803 RepID=A0A4Y2TGG9_ARAVE|nr:hypothetical protein AVEN_243414-1 [Araneus ventricosus]